MNVKIESVIKLHYRRIELVHKKLNSTNIMKSPLILQSHELTAKLNYVIL